MEGGGGVTSTRSWTGHLSQNTVQCLKYFCNMVVAFAVVVYKDLIDFTNTANNMFWLNSNVNSSMFRTDKLPTTYFLILDFIVSL